MHTRIQQLAASVLGALSVALVGTFDDRLRTALPTPEQAEILSHQSLVQLPDGLGGSVEAIRFTGVNVQVVNGLRATNGNLADPLALDPALTATNGLGNVIVGYREGTPEPGEDWRGSHNLDVGGRNTYSSFGGAALGFEGHLAGPYGTITAGEDGLASGEHATVAGGAAAIASGDAATVGGGSGNEAAGPYSVVWGGVDNTVLPASDYGSIRAGIDGQASGNYATVLGGSSGEAIGYASTLLAGSSSDASGLYAVAAGSLCEASGDHSSTLGGLLCHASGAYATVAGGQGNDAESDWSFIGGGYLNTVNGFGTFGAIAGGVRNLVQGSYGVVSGGYTRSVTGAYDWRAGSLFEED